MSRLFVALFVSALIACGSSSKYDQQQTQVAITPKGSIVGRVTEYATNAPLEGVSVTAIVGGGTVKGTTSADGLYELKDITVSSNASLLFEKEGYLRSITNGSVPSTAGNSPLAAGFSTRDMRMAKGDGEIKGLLRLPNNTPAVGATVYVDQRNSGNFDSVVTTTTDMAGNFSIKGLATAPTGINHTVIAQWFDENADGLADYQYTSASAVLFAAGNVPRVFLTYGTVGQRVLTSNLFDGEIAATEDIKLTFAVPARPSGYNGQVSRQFVLTDNTVGLEVAVDQTWTSPTEVTIKPSALREGDQYTLQINLQTTTGGTGGTPAISFQVRSATVTGPATPVANVTVQNDPVNVDRSRFDWSTNNFRVSFDTLTGISTYWVYAKDTSNNQAFARVAQTTLAPGAGRVTLSVYAPFNNGNPLSQGNKVTFVVVPVDAYGNAGSTSAATGVQVSDNIAPATQPGSVYSNTTVDAINDELTAKTIALQLSYSEPMDPAVSPVFTSFAAANVAQSFTWSQGNTSGTLTITVPASTDLSGGFVIRGGKDPAGNVVSGADFTGYLGGRKELLVNGGFEDAAGGCSLTGWTPNQTGSMAKAEVVSGAGLAQTGRCAALIGAPIGSAPQTGVGKISQDLVLPSLTNTPAFRFEVKASMRPQYFAPGMSASVAQVCKVTDTSDVNIQAVHAYSSSSQSYYDTFTQSLTPMTQGQTVRVVCSVDNSASMAAAVNGALYVDSISVALVKDTSLNQ